MPKRTDISSILVIGAGPIVIGQACEFDYSGTQAIKALKEEGYRVVLVNSNPATIMTDPDMADATYVEPITPEIVARIIEKERPDAVLPTMGGQTALNTALALFNDGTLEKYGVKMIGADADAHGFATTIAPLDEHTGELAEEGAVIIVTATYNGTPPDNAVQFVNWLETSEAKALAGVRYAVFGCGNRAPLQ